MAETQLPAPPFAVGFLSGGLIAPAWQSWLLAVWNRLGGKDDKVEAAYSAASAAAPATTEVVAGAGLQQGGQLAGNVALELYVAMTNVAELPTTGANVGDWAYALDGRKVGEASGSGTGVPVWWSQSAWYAVDSGAVVSA
jgi:hypothetical protein